MSGATRSFSALYTPENGLANASFRLVILETRSLTIRNLRLQVRRVADFVALLLLANVPVLAQAHITLRANIAPSAAHRRFADIWAEGNYAYMGSDVGSGVLIFDVSNPDLPVLVANYAPANSGDMEDPKVQNGIGYFASNNGGGVHIVDLSDPTNPRQITRITSAQGGYDNVHNVWIDGNFLYEPDYGVSPNVAVFDVSNPAAPFLVRKITTSDPNWIHDMIVKNGRLYTSGSGAHTDIWDVTDIGSRPPTLLGTINSGFRNHSCWPTEDGTVLVCTREMFTNAETNIYNISDPSNAVLLSRLLVANLGIDAIAPSNPVIVGNLLYLTWDQAGLLVFDISNPAQPLLIGNYDTWPGPAVVNQFDGGWGVFPLLGQDRVLISDRDTGLYIVDATGVSSDPVLLNFKVSPVSVTGTKSATGQVFLVGKAGAQNFSVDISGDAAIAPGTIILPPGVTSGSGAIGTNAVAASTVATVVASAGAVSDSATLTVLPARPFSLSFSPSTNVGGLNGNATLTMDSPVAVDTSATLNIVSGGASVASLPASVIVPAGFTSSAFTVGTNVVSSNSSIQISATANGSTKTGTLTVTPNVPTSFTLTPATVVAGASGTGKVTFSTTSGSPIAVSITVVSGGGALASIPSSITLAPGSTSTSFSFTSADVAVATQVQLSATANGVSKSATLTVNPNTPTSVSFSPATAIGGANSTGKVTFSRVVASDTFVPLNVVSGNSAVASMPASVTVLAGTSSSSFVVSTSSVPSATSVQISATANGSTKTGTLTVTPNVPTALTFSPSIVTGGANSTGKVTFGRAVTSDTTVALTVIAGGDAVVLIPESVTVVAGSNSASWTLRTNPVSASTLVQVSAMANGGSKTASLTVH